jgi:parallel beta-helix repeat protein
MENFWRRVFISVLTCLIVLDGAMHTAVRVTSTFLLVILIFIMMILSMISFVSKASDNTIVVPDDYPTIQAAIVAAADGSTIMVKPGTYKECLTIRKTLKIIGGGSNSTTIESAGQADTVAIARGVVGAVLKGFSVQGNGEAPWSGIYVGGLNNTVEDTVVTGHYYGIQMWDCSGNILRNNNMTGNTCNLRVYGLSPSQFLQDIDSSNRVNGKPVLYWINQQNRSVPLDVGFVGLVNSSRIVVRDLKLSNNLAGVLLAYTTNSLIMNVTAVNNEIGLWIVCSYNNMIMESNFSGNRWDGIQTISSSGNTIVGNRINGNVEDGVRLSHSFDILHSYSENNTVAGNLVSDNIDGLYLEKSNYNVVEGNAVKLNTNSGIVLDESSGNLLCENTVVNNAHGVSVSTSRDKLYHNNFMNNSVQVGSFSFFLPSLNVWDGGYPFGGNYWSDYNGTDLYMGRYQNETGSDGIGDIAYSIDANNADHYPLMGMFSDFNATSEYHVQTICNSSIFGFQFNGTAISFNVESRNDIASFCRICIPRALLNQDYRVFINGTEAVYSQLPGSNATQDYLYFILNDRTQEVVIMPEFPTYTVPLSFSTATLLVAMACRRKKSDTEA